MTEQAGTGQADREGFDTLFLPHLDAAYNLAAWLMRNRHDAEDIVQDALVRALAFYGGFRGTNPRAWLLKIVRNAALAQFNASRRAVLVPIDGDQFESGSDRELVDPRETPEVAAQHREALREVDRVLARLPIDLREVIVLRELEGLSYQEIADVTGVPPGTVMSRLWRARRQFCAKNRKRSRVHPALPDRDAGDQDAACPPLSKQPKVHPQVDPHRAA